MPKKLICTFIAYYSQIHDIDNIRCGMSGEITFNLTGRILKNLSDFDICPQAIPVSDSNKLIVTIGILSKYNSLSNPFLKICNRLIYCYL